MIRKLFAAAFAALCLAPALAADVLVMRDGNRVETKGSFKVKGKQVVFTTAGGVLSSVRLDEVDLEASNAATAERNAPPPPAAPAAKAEERKAPVLVLTNKNVGKSKAPPTPVAEDGVSAEEAAARVELSDGLEAIGRLVGSGAVRAVEQRILAAVQRAAAPAEGEEEAATPETGQPESMEILGEAVTVVSEASLSLAGIEAENDLGTPKGMLDAAGEIEATAAQIRARLAEGHFDLREPMTELATQLESLAALARTSPEAAVRRFHRDGRPTGERAEQ